MIHFIIVDILKYLLSMEYLYSLIFYGYINH